MRRKPGEVRDAIMRAFAGREKGASVQEIQAIVEELLGGPVPRSSVRSYLNLNEGGEFQRLSRGRYRRKTG